jgi:uncharacterized protein YjbJ (UPF0337 family)
LLWGDDGGSIGLIDAPRGAWEYHNIEPPTIMTKLEIKGDWNITKGVLKRKWAKLTDDDLQYIEGKQEELLGRIQKRTGETRETIESAVNNASSSIRR